MSGGASPDGDRATRASTEPASRLGHTASVPSAVPHLEIRHDENGELDEIVATFADGVVHAEMMDQDHCYVGFYWDDGRYCQWWFGVEKKKLSNRTEHGQGTPPRYTAQGVDTRPDLPDYGALAASAIEARQGRDGETRLDAKHESAVAEGETPKPIRNPTGGPESVNGSGE